MTGKPTLAYVIEPRFQGGTSMALAAELPVTTSVFEVAVHAVASAMFSTTTLSARLEAAMTSLGLGLRRGASVVAADMVVLHNPAFLKFDRALDQRLIARDLVVVTHENFLRPGGAEGFDVAGALARIDRASLALRKFIAPISPANRASVEGWAKRHGLPQGWQVTSHDWFNICDMPHLAPTARPADRRGRLSRPGFEKFPSLDDLDRCFPETAQANVILGADQLIASGVERPHWQTYRFGALTPAAFFEQIDFLVHFTAPGWRESFGRALAEAIAAGKVVLSDPETAATFGGGVVPCRPDQVDTIIAQFVAAPEAYRDQVLRAQARLGRFSPAAFERQLRDFLAEPERRAA